MSQHTMLSEGRPDWVCPSTIMIHFKPRSKRVFILGTGKPAHLINYIIPAMESTRSKLLVNCFRAHVHASTRCLLSICQRKPPSSSRYVMGGLGPLADSDRPWRNTACNHPHYSVYPMIRPTRLGASILHLMYLLPLSRTWQLEIQ